MEKIKKGYNVKIVSIIIPILFLLNSTGYGIDLSQKSLLRVSVGQKNAFQRMTEVIRNWTTKGDPAKKETLQRVRGNAELSLSPEVSHVDASIQANKKMMEALQLEQDAKDIRNEALRLIKQAIVKQADPYRVREILLEAVEFDKEINWNIFIGRISKKRIKFVKRAHRLLQQAIAFEKESDKLMKESVRLRQNSYDILHTSFLNAARSI